MYTFLFIHKYFKSTYLYVPSPGQIKGIDNKTVTEFISQATLT